MGDQYCSKCKSRLSTCPTCKGKGTTDQGGVFTTSHKSCPNCKGTGKICPKHGHDHG
jgi:DnaJ-class molecular chaperone